MTIKLKFIAGNQSLHGLYEIQGHFVPGPRIGCHEGGDDGMGWHHSRSDLALTVIPASLRSQEYEVVPGGPADDISVPSFGQDTEGGGRSDLSPPLFPFIPTSWEVSMKISTIAAMISTTTPTTLWCAGWTEEPETESLL